MPKKPPIDLITGGAGIVGTHLAEALHNQGRRVRVLDLKRWPLYPPGTEVILGDVRDRSTVQKAVKGVENIYHLSTLIQHDRVSQGVFDSVIASGGETVAELGAEAGAKSIVVFTTTEVYGHLATQPMPEDGPREPLDEYGQAKKLLEDRIFALAETGVPVSIVRPPVIVGPRFQFATIPLVFKLLRKNLPLPVIGDGQFQIQFAHVQDVVSLAMAAAAHESSQGQAFNVASKDPLPFVTLLKELKKYTGSRSPLIPIPLKSALFTMRTVNLFTSPFFMEPGQFEIMGEDYLMDLSKAKKLLGWESQYTNLDAFKDAYDWYLCMHPYPKPGHLRPEFV